MLDILDVLKANKAEQNNNREQETGAKAKPQMYEGEINQNFYGWHDGKQRNLYKLLPIVFLVIRCELLPNSDILHGLQSLLVA